MLTQVIIFTVTLRLSEGRQEVPMRLKLEAAEDLTPAAPKYMRLLRFLYSRGSHSGTREHHGVLLISDSAL
jgi:hypothetical protein